MQDHEVLLDRLAVVEAVWPGCMILDVHARFRPWRVLGLEVDGDRPARAPMAGASATLMEGLAGGSPCRRMGTSGAYRLSPLEPAGDTGAPSGASAAPLALAATVCGSNTDGGASHEADDASNSLCASGRSSVETSGTVTVAPLGRGSVRINGPAKSIDALGLTSMSERCIPLGETLMEPLRLFSVWALDRTACKFRVR